MILNIFNSFHNRLQFTMEFENDRKLNFLDLMMKVINNIVNLNWFHKKTFSRRVLSYLSNHLHCHKIGIIYNLVDRAILLPIFLLTNKKTLNFALDSSWKMITLQH